MRAVLFDEYGDEDVLRIGETPSPSLGAGQVRIEVSAAGINRADLLQRRGLYPPPAGASAILGLECAGRVSEVGEGVTTFNSGDRVMALLPGGGYAEEAVVDARCVMPTPPSFSDLEAAATPEVYLTAYLNLFVIGGVHADSTVLVHGGSGGVGNAAIQLARCAEAKIIVTAGSDDRCHRCLALGATNAINYRTEDFVAETLEATGGRGVDLIVDCIGGQYLDRNLNLLVEDGRLVVIGLLGGTRAELDLSRLLMRRLTISGSTLRSRSAVQKGQIIADFSKRFGEALQRRAIGPVVESILPLSDAQRAHRMMANGEIFGKLVLRMS
jgi:putative PIG3 family NAD(P)H quinone oxidoreductase